LKSLISKGLDLAKTRGAQYADIRVVENQTESITVKNGMVEGLDFTDTIGFGVRVLVDGAWGFASSRELTPEEIDKVTATAFEIAKASARVAGEKVDLGPPATSQGTYVTPVEIDPFTIPLEDKLEILLAADKEAGKVKGIRTHEAIMTLIKEKKWFANTEGAFTEQTIIEYSERQVKYEGYKAVITRASRFPAVTTDGFHLQVMGNIELPEEVVTVIDNGGEGIGLYRTEFQYLSRTDFPTEDELFDKYKDVVEVMASKTVTIRTLDINGDKAVAAISPGYEEKNPALGLRAIRYCLKKRDVFKTQLRAILRAACFGNVRILIPMISSCDEIRITKEILEEVSNALEKEGMDFNRDIKIGIMVEVPGVLQKVNDKLDDVGKILDSVQKNVLIRANLPVRNAKPSH